MTITIDIRPEVQAELARQAAAQGRALETYASLLLEEAAHRPEASKAPEDRRPAGRKSLAQLFAESPFRGLDITFEREPDLGRDIRL